jgi:hypothetical protein
LTGDIVAGSANDAGLQFRLADGNYERVAWTSFSQEDLKKFAQDRKLTSFVEPFIEVSQEERLKRTEVKLNDVPRLERPPPHSLLGAMFSSSVGAFVLLLLYAANIYAAYEISIFRARPIALVCGVSAVLPLIGPILFLSLRPPVKPSAEREVLAEEPAQTFNVPKAPGESSGETTAEDHPGGCGLRMRKPAPQLVRNSKRRSSSGARSLSIAGFLKRNFPASSASSGARRKRTWC